MLDFSLTPINFLKNVNKQQPKRARHTGLKSWNGMRKRTIPIAQKPFKNPKQNKRKQNTQYPLFENKLDAAAAHTHN